MILEHIQSPMTMIFSFTIIISVLERVAWLTSQKAFVVCGKSQGIKNKNIKIYTQKSDLYNKGKT
jgi:hypothetical protein